jgi:hypothetical protein
LKITTIALAALALTTTAVHAQDHPKHTVCIAAKSNEDDTVGKLIVSKFRDDVARSPRWREACTSADIYISLNTVPVPGPQNGSAIGYYAMPGKREKIGGIESGVTYCPEYNAASCADNYMPVLDAAYADIQQTK